MRAPGKRVGDLAEGGLDRALVGRKRGVALVFAQAHVGMAGAGLEDGVIGVGSGAPARRRRR